MLLSRTGRCRWRALCSIYMVSVFMLACLCNGCTAGRDKRSTVAALYKDMPQGTDTHRLHPCALYMKSASQPPLIEYTQSDTRIAALYEEMLVEDPEELKLGEELRQRLADTKRVSDSCGGYL